MKSRSRMLIFDPFAGISGDMILGGLIDLELPEEWIQDLVSSLPIAASLEVSAVKRGSLTARAVTIHSREPQRHRSLRDVLEVVDAAPIDESAREQAASTFRRLAEVEGSIHGVSPEQVHFHEVGAVDALIDIIGTTAALVELGIDACFTRRVAIGRGWVEAEHGQLPLPAPATLKLLEGIPTVDTGLAGELTTPTGAALLATLTKGRPPPGEFVPLRSGFGAGQRDPSSHPNCLRLIVAEQSEAGNMYMVQADIDDMSPEYVPPLVDTLCEAGATDVWSHPIQMKKGRTGVRIEALISEGRRDGLCQALFLASTTIGLRFWPVERQVLPRTTKTISWRGQQIRIKKSRLPDGHFRWKAEYNDIIQAAEQIGLPPLTVRRQVETTLEAEEDR